MGELSVAVRPHTELDPGRRPTCHRIPETVGQQMGEDRGGHPREDGQRRQEQMEFGAQKEGRDGPFAVQEEERRSLRANSEGGTAIGPFGCFFALDWNETCLYRPDRKAVGVPPT